jgi:ferrous iron transport protein A
LSLEKFIEQHIIENASHSQLASLPYPIHGYTSQTQKIGKNMKEGHKMVTFHQKPLGELAAGETGILRRLQGGRTFTSRLSALGFTIGAEVTVVQNYGRGPVVVSVCDTHVALGRGEAQKLLVELLPTR